MHLSYQPSLSSDVLVLFDGTAKAPMGRYLSPVYDTPAPDRGVVVPFPVTGKGARAGAAYVRPDGDAA